MRFRIYKASPLATIVNFIGAVTCYGGILALFAKEFLAGIVCVVVGLVLYFFRTDPFPVAIMTISAPLAKRMKPEEKLDLEAILLRRIRAMLRTAMADGYRKVVLGAWGCGAFGNDPEVVARLFHQVLTESFGPDNGYRASDFFNEITMAVMDTAEGSPRYHSFARYFGE